MTGIIDVPATHEHLREIRAVLDSYPGDRTSVGEVFLLDPAQVADVLRRRRRAAPVVQLRAAVQPLAGGQLGAQHPHRVGRARRRRALGHVGAVEPRQPAPPHPLRRRRAHRPRRRGAAPHAAGHAVPLRRRGARPRGRRRAARAPRRSERAAGATAAGPRSRGRRAGARLGERRHLAAVPAGARASATRRRCARTRARSCTCTATCWRCGAGRRRCSSARSRCSTSPDDVLVYERRHGDDARVVAISFSDDAGRGVTRDGHVELSSDPDARRGRRLGRPLRPYEARCSADDA